jgi:signal transduction histidine kinase
VHDADSPALRRRWPLAVALLAAVAAGTSAALAVLVLKGKGGASATDIVWVCSWLSFAVVGALVLSEKPGHRGAQAFLALGTVVPLAGLVDQLAHVVADRNGTDAASVAWLRLVQDLAFSAGLNLVVLSLLLLPDGVLARRWMRWPARAAVTAALLLLVVGALMPGPIGEELPVDNPMGVDAAAAVMQPLESGLGVVLLLGGLTGVLSILMRARGAQGKTRSQLSWLGLGVLAVTIVNALGYALTWFGLALSDSAGAVVSASSVLVIPICVAIAVLRHNLFDVELLLRRSLLYTALSALVIALYLLVAGWLGITADTGGRSAVLGAGIALAVLPLRHLGQRWLDRRFYGEAGDPYGVLTGLGRRLTEAGRADDVPQAVADSLRSALRVPWAAVELGSELAPVGVAASGERPRWDSVVVPLHVHGVEVGRLLVAPRGPREPLQDRDKRLLAGLADQVAVAVDGLRLTRELQRSRELLVAAREEERRRLRNDLHDGLGPVLAGVMLQLGLAIEQTPDVRLEAAERQLRGAVDDLRRLVHGLRPPALDELGLVGALREHVASLEGALQIAFTAGDLPQLPAAVEVAAYRVATEAMTNVLRHAAARTCQVQVTGDADGLRYGTTVAGRTARPGWACGR